MLDLRDLAQADRWYRRSPEVQTEGDAREGDTQAKVHISAALDHYHQPA